MKQIDTEYTVDGVTYAVHLSLDQVDEEVYRAGFQFKFTPEDERKSMFYCFTTDPEIIFIYIIRAYKKYGPTEWKKQLKFNYQTKALTYEGESLPV